MNWRKTAAVLAAIAVLLAIGLAIAITRIDFNRFKPDIAAAARNALGRELTLAGDIDLKIGFRPALAVENVSFENADWGSRPELATIQRLEIEVSLLPLLKKEIEIHRLVLIDPDILVETDPNGTSNLSFSPAAGKKASPPGTAVDKSPQVEATPPAASPPLLTFHRVDIQNGRITYRDGRTGASHTVAVERFTSSPAPEDDQMKLMLKGAYNRQPFELTGIAGRLKSLLDPNVEWPADLVAKAAGWTVAARGSLRDVLRMTGVNLSLGIEGDTGAVPRIGEMAGIGKRLPDVGPVRFSGRLLDAAPGVFSLNDINLSGRPAGAVLTVKGAIHDLTARKGVLNVHLAAPSLPRLGALVEVRDLPDLGPVTVDADLEIPDAATVHTTNLRAAFLESDIGGTGTLTLSGKRPKLTAALSSKRLDLRPFASQASSDAPPPPAPKKRSGKDRVFSPEPLPLDRLKQIDADIHLRLANVLMEKAAFTDLEADVRLDAGRLRMAPIRASTDGSTWTVALEIDASKQIPTISKKLQVKRLNLGQMFKTLGIKDTVAGTGDVDADLTSRGRSVAEVMGNMDGRMIFAFQNGFVKQQGLDLVSFEFATGLVKQMFSLLGTPPGEKAEIRCLFGNLDVRNGIVDVSPFVMNTPKMSVFGSGDINLKNERLNLSVSTEPTQKADVINFSIGQLTQIFKLTGTLARPALGIDPVESSVFLAKAFGGATLVGTTLAVEALLGSKNAKDNPCLRMLESSDGKSPASKAAEKTGNTLKKTVEDAGKSIMNIFKKP